VSEVENCELTKIVFTCIPFVLPYGVKLATVNRALGRQCPTAGRAEKANFGGEKGPGIYSCVQGAVPGAVVFSRLAA
jgi:hypothetical protein